MVAEPTERSVCQRPSCESGRQPDTVLGAAPVPNMSLNTLCRLTSPPEDGLNEHAALATCGSSAPAQSATAASQIEDTRRIETSRDRIDRWVSTHLSLSPTSARPHRPQKNRQ